MAVVLLIVHAELELVAEHLAQVGVEGVLLGHHAVQKLLLLLLELILLKRSVHLLTVTRVEHT